jgi:7,8-dihydro-6-hydroxymethylpterin-pyrophosphokinase
LEVGQRHIPDPDLLQYAHIAVPMADLAPQYVHPETGETLQEVAKGLPLAGLTPQPGIKLTQDSTRSHAQCEV